MLRQLLAIALPVTLLACAQSNEKEVEEKEETSSVIQSQPMDGYWIWRHDEVCQYDPVSTSHRATAATMETSRPGLYVLRSLDPLQGPTMILEQEADAEMGRFTGHLYLDLPIHLSGTNDHLAGNYAISYPGWGTCAVSVDLSRYAGPQVCDLLGADKYAAVQKAVAAAVEADTRFDDLDAFWQQYEYTLWRQRASSPGLYLWDGADWIFQNEDTTTTLLWPGGESWARFNTWENNVTTPVDKWQNGHFEWTYSYVRELDTLKVTLDDWSYREAGRWVYKPDDPSMWLVESAPFGYLRDEWSATSTRTIKMEIHLPGHDLQFAFFGNGPTDVTLTFNGETKRLPGDLASTCSTLTDSMTALFPTVGRLLTESYPLWKVHPSRWQP